MPASFIQKTGEALPGLDRLHNLIEGIYKPAGGDYALSIASMLKNPYADRVEYNPDRSWYFDYSPKAGSLKSAVNASLFNCLGDKEPVLVLKQLSDKTGPNGTRYRLLGLGLLEGYDEQVRLFRIRGMRIEEIYEYLGEGMVMEDDLIDTAIQLEALEAWNPFEDPNRRLYRVNAQKRSQHFRRIVLGNYNSTCAVTGQRFELNDIVEAEAAHVISKEQNGTDNPKNGIAMSRSVHWAFDKGLFTLSDQYEVLIHPEAKAAKIQNFPLFELDRKKIYLPDEEYFHPHQEALQWHRDEIWGKFAG
ncbi:hypothetical protein G0Q06_10565 [Puniceicoccales bacterium CK1056]|uniref:HNH nuclease domain-containing protein n=1 Tax=Oceanipulchritudo coccoides TaxID=2706888 RepID=A0A6B2M463_9BACT|nr:hypothetical protein [Oceanipulchritudo coccoides]